MLPRMAPIRIKEGFGAGVTTTPVTDVEVAVIGTVDVDVVVEVIDVSVVVVAKDVTIGASLVFVVGGASVCVGVVVCIVELFVIGISHTHATGAREQSMRFESPDR
jgi:hypothetical protein